MNRSINKHTNMKDGTYCRHDDYWVTAEKHTTVRV